MKASNSSKESRTDWERLKQMPDSDIDFGEIQELGEDFFANAKIRMPQTKKAVSIRLDQDILAWFRHQGRGYQTRINSVLRSYMLAHNK
jgi:uncharacterized protein (DUF4415 family)